MQPLGRSLSFGVLLTLCVFGSRASAKVQVPTPAQIITEQGVDWVVEKDGGAKKSGDKFVMRFDRATKTYKTVVIELNDKPEDVARKRRALALKAPEGKWSIQNGKIELQRFIGGGGIKSP